MAMVKFQILNMKTKDIIMSIDTDFNNYDDIEIIQNDYNLNNNIDTQLIIKSI